MKVAVVNDIHVGKLMKHKGQVRAASHLAENVSRVASSYNGETSA